MIPCCGCQRHIRADESACPFCGAGQAGTSAPTGWWDMGVVLLAGAMALGTTACGPPQTSLSTSGVSSGSTETTAATETTAVMSTETETDTGDQTNDSANTSGSFYAPSSDWTSVSECDPFAQDCPEGEKCVPYGSSGGNWDATKCVPVLGDGAPGDPCSWGGSSDATDDCGESSYCWNVVEVEGEQIGVCVAFCGGTADDPICAEDESCLIANNESITLCMPKCDPVMQDCAEGTACYYANDTFMCLFTVQDVPAGEGCGFLNDCTAGHGCISDELLWDCDATACCALYCDTDAVQPCPDEGQTCESFFTDEFPPPAGYETIGVCVNPMP